MLQRNIQQAEITGEPRVVRRTQTGKRSWARFTGKMQVNLRPEVEEAIEAIADARGGTTTKSTIVREALNQYLHRHIARAVGDNRVVLHIEIPEHLADEIDLLAKISAGNKNEFMQAAVGAHVRASDGTLHYAREFLDEHPEMADTHDLRVPFLAWLTKRHEEAAELITRQTEPSRCQWVHDSGERISQGPNEGEA
jgi:metal-responsive CopG/Arc/MetJ family transcriptional regulator